MSFISLSHNRYEHLLLYGAENCLRTKYMLLLTLFFTLSHAVPVSALNEIVINDSTSKISLGAHLQYFEDKNGSLTFRQIISGDLNSQFINSREPAPSFGFTNSTYWFQFRIKNQNNKNKL